MATRVPAKPPAVEGIDTDVERSLREDIGDGDATAGLLPANVRASAVLVCRDDAVLSGSDWFDACFHKLDADIDIQWQAHDGAHVAAGSTVCHLHGNAQTMVTAERTAINFLQTLSATATLTARYVAAVAGTGAVVLDTRKTLPGLRLAQKYAVRCGGGSNHRIGLFDAILIKENHIAAAGGVVEAIRAARAHRPDLLLEIEVESLQQLQQALALDVDRIMLDNFTPTMLTEAVQCAAGRVALEVSGNVRLEGIRRIAETGVDFISVGALTKHVHAVDLSLRLSLEP